MTQTQQDLILTKKTPFTIHPTPNFKFELFDKASDLSITDGLHITDVLTL